MTSDIFAEAPTPGRTRRSGFSPMTGGNPRGTKAAALLAAALLLPAAPAAAEELGKLFLTPERRAALERQRQLNIRESQPVIEGATLMVTGVVKRSSGKSTTWVNGTPQA